MRTQKTFRRKARVNANIRLVYSVSMGGVVTIFFFLAFVCSFSVSEFAVPKFLFTNICSLAKTKNRVRAAVALEADLNNKDIDVCIVSETHLKPEMPDAIVNIPGYSIFRRDRY